MKKYTDFIKKIREAKPPYRGPPEASYWQLMDMYHNLELYYGFSVNDIDIVRAMKKRYGWTIGDFYRAYCDLVDFRDSIANYPAYFISRLKHYSKERENECDDTTDKTETGTTFTKAAFEL